MKLEQFKERLNQMFDSMREYVETIANERTAYFLFCKFRDEKVDLFIENIEPENRSHEETLSIVSYLKSELKDISRLDAFPGMYYRHAENIFNKIIAEFLNKAVCGQFEGEKKCYSKT